MINCFVVVSRKNIHYKLINAIKSTSLTIIHKIDKVYRLCHYIYDKCNLSKDIIFDILVFILDNIKFNNIYKLLDIIFYSLIKLILFKKL